MKRLVCIVCWLICSLLPQASWAGESVFALVKEGEVKTSLQEWDSETLEVIQSWSLNPELGLLHGTDVFVDAKEKKALFRPFLSEPPTLVELNLITGKHKKTLDLDEGRALTYRYVKGQLEALLPNPDRDGRPAHWQIWQLKGEAWVEVKGLRTKSLEDLVPNHRWLAIADFALKVVRPTFRLEPPFSACSVGGGVLPHSRAFGWSGGGAIDLKRGTSLVMAWDDGLQNVFVIIGQQGVGMRVLTPKSRLYVDDLALAGEWVVVITLDGKAVSCDLDGNIKAQKQSEARLAKLIG